MGRTKKKGAVETRYSLWKTKKYLKRPQMIFSPITDTKGRWAKTKLDELGDQIRSRLETPYQMILPMANMTQQKIKHVVNNEKNHNNHRDMIKSLVEHFKNYLKRQSGLLIKYTMLPSKLDSRETNRRTEII